MSQKLRAVLLVVFSVVLVYSLTRILLMQAEYKKADEIYSKSRSENFHVSQQPQEAGSMEEHKEFFPEVFVDFETLKATNADVVGWLWLPETNINHPLLQAETNWKYLNLSYDLQRTNSGSIFMDYRNSFAFNDDNTVIYGHNMKNGGMFGELKKFAGAEYLKQHSDLYIFTENSIYKYRIFAAYKTESDSQSYALDFPENFDFDGFIEYIESCTDESSYNAPAESTPIITLSTCTSTGRSERFVVHGFLVAVKSLDKADFESSLADKMARNCP